jgi:hypothetical protein
MKKPKPRKIPKADRRGNDQWIQIGDAATRAALHQRVTFERSLPSTAAREAHLRSLMGLPDRERDR